MEQAEIPENVNALIGQFSKLGVQISWNMCNRVIEDIKKVYPNLPKEDFLEIAVKTFENSEISLDLKISTTKTKVKEGSRCSKILLSGKNKGRNCSLPKTKGSEFCKRHLGQIFSSSTKKDIQRDHLKNYLSIIQPKTSELKIPKPMNLSQHGNDNLYMEIETNLLFKKVNDEYIAVNMYDQNEGIKDLGSEERRLCEINLWKHK